MIRNVVFDMGKVLLNWDPLQPCLRYAANAEQARRLCDAIFDHPEWGPIIDGGLMEEHEYFDHCRARMDDPELRRLSEEMEKDWWVDALYPMHRIDKVLEGLLARGYRLYVLSNCGHRFHDFEYKIPYLEQFSGIMVSAEEGVLKPSAEIFERLCERFDLKAEECVFVDDLQRNVDGARAVGMQGYCHADGNAEKLWKYLESLNG